MADCSLFVVSESSDEEVGMEDFVHEPSESEVRLPVLFCQMITYSRQQSEAAFSQNRQL